LQIASIGVVELSAPRCSAASRHGGSLQLAPLLADLGRQILSCRLSRESD
jgi:hypothetical protein